jgi:hypothetical protein
MRRNLTDGDEVTYYLMDDDIELFSIVLDFYDITTNLMEELNAKIQTTFMPYIFKNL